ncbi:4-hydroxyphenylacetate 3-monooxygenase [Peribacillus cavernae]|uniref:4-hydroxyphenylacetate 3-monooxygenase n=1 Tax=Peribacillus cavernae TaxID=1674310 RepID=A0A433HPA4_9BACI|nr:4-hydroxyphenylacetate 3-hydroxylase N-terminal domain-containing protein [Peribacillus cavernae]MDQ0217390.1 aromatic ring hydroxylase [Peribacillus cavernae]RUQ30161.1 4-hydroxyphenylacetate 3-monooxygenase [Peribacillus cavernae]
MSVATVTSKIKEVLSQGSEPHLMTGEQYKESLRDGRRVIDSQGSEVADVPTHPALKRGVENLAKIYDMQFDPATKDIATFISPEDGKRYSTNWLVPKTKEDYKIRREMLKLSTYSTLGVFGRPNDYGSMMAMGFLSIIDKIEKENPEYADNVRKFVEFSQKHNITSADLIPDVQTDKNLPASEKKGTLRVVEERPDGIVLSGAKPVGSAGVQGHFATVSTATSANLELEAALWCAVPMNSPGITLVLREPVTAPDSSFEDHPIDSQGEETDNMILFDNVFLPREYVFSLRNLKMLGLYRESGSLFHWHILGRLMYRSEILVGAVQTIVDVLGTSSFQGVRDAVAEVITYSSTLKAAIIAAEEQSEMWNGVLVPSTRFLTAGRLYSIENYPRIMHILRDLSGQGLISRFPGKVWDHPEIGAKLEEYLPGAGVSARDKNKFFNFIWDLTSSSHASRVGLFENLNATNAPVIRSELYRSYERTEQTNFVRDYLGLPRANGEIKPLYKHDLR